MRKSSSPHHFTFRVLPAAVLAAGLSWCVESARAVNYTWNGTTGNWSNTNPTSANWDNGVPASSLDTTLQFGSGTYTSTDDLTPAAFTLNGLTLSATSGAPTITGSAGDSLVFVNNTGGTSPFINVTGTSTTTINGFTNATLGTGVVLNLTGTGSGQAGLGIAFTGGGSIVVNSTGATSTQFALTGTSNFSGGLTLTVGRVALTAASTGTVGAVTGGSLGTGTFSWNGGYVRTSTSSGRIISNAVTIGGNIGLGDNVTPSNGAQTLTLNGATTLAAAQSTYTLTVAASAATVAPVNFAGAIGETTAGTGVTVAAAGTAGGTVTFSGAAANTYTGTTTVGGTAAAVASVLLLNKTAGVNALGSTNLTINAFGTVRLGASNQIPDTAAINLAGGTFDLNGSSETVGSLASSSTTSTITNGTASTTSTLTLSSTSTGSNTYAGAIQNGAGTVALVKGGTDTLVLNNASTNYSGGTTLNSGAIAISNVAAVGTGTITLNGGFFRGTNSFIGTLPNAVNIGGDVTLGQNTPATTSVVTLSGPTTLLGVGATRTLSIGGAFGATTATPVVFGGAIGDGGNANGVNIALGTLPSAQSGTMTFNGANTYTGPTNVNSGTLLINGNSSAATGAVTVRPGATLGGAGTVGGATTVSGILAVGSVSTTPAVMTFSNAGTGALTLAGTAAFDVTGAGGAANRGLTYDAVTLSGTGLLTYGGALTVNLNGTTPTAGTSYDLFDFNNETGTFSSIAVTGGGASYGGVFDPASGVLTLTAVPEPSTWVGAVLMLGALGWRYRRSQSTATAPAA